MKKLLQLKTMLLLCALIVGSGSIWAQASVNTIMWSETWTGATTATSGSNSATPSANYGKGTTVYNSGTVTYTQSANTVYVRNEALAKGTAPELLLSSGKTWTISDIPTGGAVDLSLTYKSNNTNSSVTCSTSGTSVSGSSKAYTITTGGAETITLVFACSSNTRIDDVELKVKTAGSGGEQSTTYSVTYDGNGETSGSVPVDNTEYDDENNTVTVLGNTGSLTKTNYAFNGWNTASDGTGTSYKKDDTFTISENTTLYAQWLLDIEPASLPFSYDGNGTGDLPTGFIVSGIGTYDSSPKMKFDNTGDYIILHFDEAPGILSFDIKGNSFSGSTFKVQTSEDGIIYSDLESYTKLGATQSESFDNIDSDVRYIRWIYTNKSGGNVALGNINLIAASAVRYTVTYNGNGNDDGSAPTDNTEYESGDDVTVLGSNTLTKTGYDFFCWSDTNDENGNLYEEGDVFTITSNTTLYAIWTLKEYAYTLNVTGDDSEALATLSVGGVELGGSDKIEYGSEVTVNVVTSIGYNYTISVKDASDNTITVTDNTFNMPASAVTVTVTTVEDPNLYASFTSTNFSEMSNAGDGYYITKSLIKDGLTWTTTGYQTGSQKDMIQLKKEDSDVYVKLPEFSGNIQSITFSVTGVSANSKGGAKTTNQLCLKSSKGGTTIVTSDGTETNEITLDLSGLGDNYNTGYIYAVGGSLRIWDITVAYIPTNINVSISSAKYATFSDHLARDFSGSGITVYKAKSNGTTVTLTEVTGGVVPANTGVVLFSETVKNNVAIPLTASNATLTDNELVGINEATTVKMEDGTKTNYILSNEDAGVGFYLARVVGATLAAHRAYLSTTLTTDAREFLGFDINESTGVKELKNSNVEELNIYNLAGQRVTEPQKGLYIVNGKKIFK